MPKLLAGLMIAGASGVLGYGLGFRAAQPASPEPGQRATQTAVPADPLAASAADAVRESEPVPEPESEPVSDSVSEPESEPVSDSVSGPDSVSPRRGITTRSTPSPAAEPEPVPTEPDPHALARELRALRRVERALREQQPRRALELLGELDRDVPEGRLVEERLATFLMARCALGLGTPARLRGEFNDAYPRSVYRARVEQSCGDGGRRE
jgi:hypothetical protein